MRKNTAIRGPVVFRQAEFPWANGDVILVLNNIQEEEYGRYRCFRPEGMGRQAC
jgi:hypothetical protein